MARNFSSLVIDNLCDEPCKEDTAIAMFYCDFSDQQEQTTTNIIGAILKQLVVRKEVLGVVQKAFQKAKNEVGGRGLLLPDMVQMLEQVTASLPRVFICIDALDECVPQYVRGLLVSLKGILKESQKMRVFLTGRPQVGAEITRHFITGIIVPVSPKAQDIRRYLENKLEMDTEHYAMSAGLRADILRIIPERVSGMCVGESPFIYGPIFINHGGQIPPCFADHRCYPWRGYDRYKKRKVERDNQGQSFGGCVCDNARPNKGAKGG